MSIGPHIRYWRLKRRLSMAEVEKGAGLAPSSLEALEAGELDPPVSTLVAVADVLGVPVPWLYEDPERISGLFQDDEVDEAAFQEADPITRQILSAKSNNRDLFHLLATLVMYGDAKLLRAAQVNLESLVKETRHSPVPWANRQPGNFDPPSD